MPTYHLHFKGVVQGVGFRPFVFDSARSRNLKGWVKNSGKGLEIVLTADEAEAQAFYSYLIANAPPHSLITSNSFKKIPDQNYDDFRIIESTGEKVEGALLPPDIAMCDQCREEIKDGNNRRYEYAFTTCLHCGPRYSIIRKLPYDRLHTTMADLQMCMYCRSEYEEPDGYRQHSQTNSCPDCPIPMALFDSKKTCLDRDPGRIIQHCINALKKGKILAVKGIGGYLLLADATNEESILTLRRRKKRPSKPFAVMYPDINSAKEDAWIAPFEESALKDADAPVLLALRKEKPLSGLCSEAVAPGLGTVGILLPYSPFFELIIAGINRPLIATSANLSGSPIIYADEQAIEYLGAIADYILTFEREIVTPQDDSVIQLSNDGSRILLRRSRGLSPNYNPHPFGDIGKRALAYGADLKSTFALADREKLIISQYLGNQESYDSQLAFRHTLKHIQELYSFRPEVLLADAHPDYHSRAMAEKNAEALDLKLIPVQHHVAHFTAVLTEHGLLKSDRDVLGFIWDGAGYGDDGQIWGGEVFLKDHKGISRELHIDYFPILSGDKMSLEPRLSARSLFADIPEAEPILRSQFSDKEWNYFQKMIEVPAQIQTSSMGRFIDAIAAILGIGSFNSYESEAAMKLENRARKRSNTASGDYTFVIRNEIIDWRPVLEKILVDIHKEKKCDYIARGLFLALGKLVFQVSKQKGVKDLAFSGGVFQNVVLINTLINLKPVDTRLWFHQKLSPNDENISFGQIAYYDMISRG